MSEHSEVLKSMLQDIINDRQEQASVTMHDYFVLKTCEISGLSAETPEAREFEVIEHEINKE